MNCQGGHGRAWLTPLKNLVNFGISTVSVHAGEYIDEVTKAVVTPNPL